jgi:hypothetical protein
MANRRLVETETVVGPDLDYYSARPSRSHATGYGGCKCFSLAVLEPVRRISLQSWS